MSRGYHGNGYSVYTKETQKIIDKKAEEKRLKEEKEFQENNKIISYICTRSKEELMKMFIEAKGDKLVSWAKEQNII